MIKKFFYHHYITTGVDGVVTMGWSDGPHPEKDTSGAICINDKGTYQFCLYPDGEENPQILDIDGVSLYKWNGGKIVPRTAEELEVDRTKLSA